MADQRRTDAMPAATASRESLHFAGTGWQLLWRGIVAWFLALLILPAGVGWRMLAEWFVTNLRLPDGRAFEFRLRGGFVGAAIAITLVSLLLPTPFAEPLRLSQLPVRSPAVRQWGSNAAWTIARRLAGPLHVSEERIVASLKIRPDPLRPIEFFPAATIRGLVPVWLDSVLVIFCVGIYVLVCSMWLVVAQTVIQGVAIPGLGTCRFRRCFLPYVGWNLLMNLSYLTIIGWAWVEMALIRWFLRNTGIPETRTRLVFTGTGLENLWRSLLVVIVSVLTVGLALPWMLIWYYRWLASQTVLERG